MEFAVFASHASDLTEPRVVIAVDDPALRSRIVDAARQLGLAPSVAAPADCLETLSAAADDELRIIIQSFQHPDSILRLLLRAKWSLRSAVTRVHLIGVPRSPKPELGIKLSDRRFALNWRSDNGSYNEMLVPSADSAEWTIALRREHGSSPRLLPMELLCSTAGPGEPEPDEPPRLAQGLAQLEAGYSDVALETLTAALAAAPENPLAHCVLGRALYEWGDLDAALERLLDALRIDPSLQQAHRLAAMIYYYKRVYAEAADHFNYCIQHAVDRGGPNYNTSLIYLAVSLRRIGRASEVAALLKEAYWLTDDSEERAILAAVRDTPDNPWWDHP